MLTNDVVSFEQPGPVDQLAVWLSDTDSWINHLAVSESISLSFETRLSYNMFRVSTSAHLLRFSI